MIEVLEQKDLELHVLAAAIHHKEVKIEEQGTKLHEVNDIENNMKILKVSIRFTQLYVLLVEHYYFGSLIIYANVAHTAVVESLSWGGWCSAAQRAGDEALRSSGTFKAPGITHQPPAQASD